MSGGRAFWREGATGANVLRWDGVLETARKHMWLEWSEQEREKGGKDGERMGALQTSSRTHGRWWEWRARRPVRSITIISA